MSEEVDADLILDQVVEKDPRYGRQAYIFMMEALKHTTSRLPVRRHVTGQELSMGILDYALRQYGVASRLVLEQWGITRTRDFGEIVYNLVESGLMSKTEEDSIDDFNEVYDLGAELDSRSRIIVDKTRL